MEQLQQNSGIVFKTLFIILISLLLFIFSLIAFKGFTLSIKSDCFYLGKEVEQVEVY